MPEKETISLLLASNNDALADKIRQCGMNIVQTRDGFETIKAVIEQKPSAVLLDDLTSGLPSPTVAIWLKLNYGTNMLPLIGLSNTSNGWREAKVDAELNPNDPIENLASLVSDLMASSRKEDDFTSHDDVRFNPLEITLDLIDVYRERLLLAGAMIELASLQHDLGDFDYTIKSILEAAGRALGSDLISITLIRELTHYTLVRGNDYARRHIEALDDFSSLSLSTLFDKPIEIDNQLVIGRRKLAEINIDKPAARFIGHPIWSRGEVLGYLACAAPGNPSLQAHYHNLLSDLTSQIALLLVNADLITTQESYLLELSSILRATVETSSISSITEKSSKGFLLQFLLIILELCHTDRGCVILFDRETGEISETASLGVEACAILDEPVKNRKTLAEELVNFPPGEVYTDSVYIEGQKLTRVIAPLSAGEENVGGLVIFGKALNITHRIEEAIKALASQAGYLANNRKLHEKVVETSIIESQLKTAHEVQLAMLPDKQPDFPGYDIHGVSRPAKEVGGDFFDYFPGKKSLNIAIADVCGKSIPASLLMTMSRGFFLAAIDSSDGPDEVIAKVNSLLLRTITQGKFVTGALLNLHEKGASYSNAGHQPLLIYRASRDEFEQVNADGIALGIIDFSDFERVNIVLERGDVAMLYTDGLNESMNPERKQFGYENVKHVVRVNANKTSREIIDSLFTAVAAHSNGADQHDDTTIVVIKKN